MKNEMQPSQGHYYFRGDRQIWIIVFLLMLLSVVEVYSTTASLAYRIAGGDTSHYLLKQVGLLALGAVAMFFFQMIPMGKIAKLAKPVLLVMICLLVFTLFFGMEANSARRWTRLFGMTLQPSDLVKIPLILYVANFLAEKRKQLESFSFVFVNLFCIIGLVCFLILIANLSTALLLGLTCFVIMMMGNVPKKHLFNTLFAAIVGFGAFLWAAPHLKFLPLRISTWGNRLWNFVFEGGDNFQAMHAKIAIANGLLWGKGPGNSMQRLVLPESYSDFIFASIVEEGGLLMAIAVMGLYLWLLYRIYVIMRASRRPYHVYLCAGFGLLIVFQAFVHICISVGWGPVTGLSLPLVSMGGSSVLATCVALGMIQSVARQQKRELYEGEEQDAA